MEFGAVQTDLDFRRDQKYDGVSRGIVALPAEKSWEQGLDGWLLNMIPQAGVLNQSLCVEIQKPPVHLGPRFGRLTGVVLDEVLNLGQEFSTRDVSTS